MMTPMNLENGQAFQQFEMNWFTYTRRKEEKGFVSWVIDFDRFVVVYFYS